MSSTSEFVVRVPREQTDKKFHVMRFGSALNVEPNKWKSCQMFRENEQKDVKLENDSEVKEFGAGSEFGRRQREEMRRKKYQKRSSGAQQPWILKTSGKMAKKYKGLREGGVSENASYYVFFQAPDGAFEAFPVSEWYNFTPIQRYKALTAEEAEEKFEKRDKIYNYFSIMINKKRNDDKKSDNMTESKTKVKKELKVSDMDDWHGFDSDNERSDLEDKDDEDIQTNSKKGKKGSKGKKLTKKKKKKSSDDDEDDSEPQEESDEGDFDDKEVDYMSETSDDSEESETEKNDKEMKGVEDEDALRQLVLSESDDEEENKDEDEKDEDGNKLQNSDKNRTENEKKSEFKDRLSANFDSPPPSSGSDSDDPDSVDDKKSALLAPVKLELDKSSRGSSRSATPTANLEASTSSNGTSFESNKLKRKLLTTDSTNLNIKKPKILNDNSEGITEDSVRRYLMRKPMTSTDLLQKFWSSMFKNKTKDEKDIKETKDKKDKKDELVHTIAQILRRLKPEQKNIKGKLYFSLKPT